MAFRTRRQDDKPKSCQRDRSDGCKVLFVGYFSLGPYAQSRGWFADSKPLGSLAVWGAISAALAMAYLVAFQPMVADLGGTSRLPVGLVLAFAFVRSFLTVSLLIVLVSAGARYWNRSSGLDRQLSETSYNIYLTHIWFVVAIQDALMAWMGGPRSPSARLFLSRASQ